MLARWPPEPEPQSDTDQPRHVDHGDHDAAAEDPAEQCEADADLVPGEGEAVLLGHDAGHPHPDRDRQRIAQDEERRGDRMHPSSMPEKAGRVRRVAPQPSTDLVVGELERRQQPVGVTPRWPIEQRHLGPGDEEARLVRRGQERGGERSDQRSSPKAAVPPAPHVADPTRWSDVGRRRRAPTPVEGRPVEEQDDRVDQGNRSRQRLVAPVGVRAAGKRCALERQEVAGLQVQSISDRGQLFGQID